MEQIDIAFKKAQKLFDDIKRHSGNIFTEQDTRVKVIDRIFVDVLCTFPKV